MKPGQVNPLRRWWKACAVSLLLGLGAIWVTVSRSADGSILDAIRSIPLGILPVLILLTLGTWTFHGCRYWILARAHNQRISLGDCIKIAVSVDFSVAATPSGSGGAVARLALLKRKGIDLCLGSSVLAVNVFVDLCVSALLAGVAAVVVASDPQWRAILSPLSSLGAGDIGRKAIFVATTLALAAIAALAALRWLSKSNFNRCTSPPLIRKLRHGILRGMRFLRISWKSTRHLFVRRRWAVLGDFVCALGQWTCRYGILPALVAIFGGDINLLPLFAVQGLVFIAALVLILPGGGGGVELLSAFILPAFVPIDSVATVLILWRFFTYYLYLLVGAPTLAWTLSK